MSEPTELQVTKARMAILQSIPERWRYEITRDEAHAIATAAVSAALSGEGWHPIGTAPMAEWVLVWRPGSVVRDAAQWRDGERTGWSEGRGGAMDPPPTHWMRPPEPPQ